MSKADLTTNIVDEFPKLQGIMGEKYARMDGEEEIVAQGIAEHYLPRFNKDEIPATLPGTVNSLADKIDNIASSFAIGERPTGNQDPFALRRQAIGIVNIITQGKWRLDLAGLFREAIDLLPKEALVDSAEHILTDILDFFKVRIKTVFQEQGFQGDLIESVLAVEVSDIFNAYEKTRLLQGLRGNEIFDHVTTAYQRLKNLSGKANGDPVNLELLREEQEEKLYREYSDIDGRVDKYLNQTDIKNAMHLLASLKPYVDAFFDHVLVMHEDTSVRNNRLNLIYQVKEMYRKIAEFSMLQA